RSSRSRWSNRTDDARPHTRSSKDLSNSTFDSNASPANSGRAKRSVWPSIMRSSTPSYPPRPPHCAIWAHGQRGPGSVENEIFNSSGAAECMPITRLRCRNRDTGRAGQSHKLGPVAVIERNSLAAAPGEKVALGIARQDDFLDAVAARDVPDERFEHR